MINANLAKLHNNHGRVLIAVGRLEEAAPQFRAALSFLPDYADALAGLATVFCEQGLVDEAVAECHNALKCDPKHGESQYILGQIRQRQGRFAEARDHYRAAAAVAPENAEVHYLAMEALLASERAEDRRELAWIMSDLSYHRQTLTKPRWSGERLEGRTLLVLGEGGFGDTIQLSRYLPWAQEFAQGEIIFECQKELMSLLGNGLGARQVIPKNARVPLPPFDTCVRLYDLPLLLVHLGVPLPKTIPYLTPDATAVRRWRERLRPSEGLRVGLRWAGNPHYSDDAFRSCRLSDFAPLAEVPGVTFYSLQKGAREEEAADPPAGMALQDLSPHLHDFTETAAALVNLDLLISTDTAVPHLAAALGVPVWLLLDAYPNNRWHWHGRESAWYPTMRLFRQQRRGDWEPVLREVAELLRERAETPIQAA